MFNRFINLFTKVELFLNNKDMKSTDDVSLIDLSLNRMCATKQLYEETDCEREAGVWKRETRDRVLIEETIQLGTFNIIVIIKIIEK